MKKIFWTMIMMTGVYLLPGCNNTTPQGIVGNNNGDAQISGATQATTTQYEAENATLSGGANKNNNHNGSSGGYFVDGFYLSTTAQAAFKVNAASAGNYTLTLRYSAGNGTSTNTGFYVNGTKLKNITCAATSNWDTWANETETVTLNAGNNTIAYKADASSGSCINLDYITVTGGSMTTYTITASAGANGSISPSGSVSVNSGANQTFTITPNGGYQINSVAVDGANQGAVPSYPFTNVTANHAISATFVQQSTGNTYEAENATLSGGANKNTNHAGYSGTGFVDGFFNSSTAQASFAVTAASAGSYTLTLHYSAGNGASSNTGLYINGTKIKNITCAATANWDTWADETETVTLNAGNNAILYKADASSGSCINLDKLTVSANGCTPPTITSQPQSAVVCDGQTVIFTVQASGTGLSYAWYDAQHGTVMGSTSASLSLIAVSGGLTSFYCVVKNSSGCSVQSATAQLTVNPAPVIISQPQNAVVCDGQTVTFTVQANGTGLSYAWYDAQHGTVMGSTSASLSVIAVSGGLTSFYCVVKNGSGCSVRSATAQLTVNPAPVITSQPQSVTAYDGQTVTFTVQASGTGLSYAWYDAQHGTVMGSTSASLSLIAVSGGLTSFYCVVKNGSGCSVQSATAQLTLSQAPVITSQPQSVTTCDGQTVTFTVQASGTGLSYAWYDAQHGTVMGSTSPSLSMIAVTGGLTSFYCVVKNSAGFSARSNTAQLTVNPIPTMNPITNSSWYQQQGVGGNPNSHFWVQIDVPAGTTGYMTITNTVYPQFNVTAAQVTQRWPEVSTNYMNMPPAAVTVEYWCVNANGCASQHLIWQNPIWGF